MATIGGWGGGGCVNETHPFLIITLSDKFIKKNILRSINGLIVNNAFELLNYSRNIQMTASLVYKLLLIILRNHCNN